MRALAYEGWDDRLVLHVLLHMRATDAAEVFALRPDEDPFALYRDMAALRPVMPWFELVRPAARMEPIALFGVTLTSPGCAQAHLMATPDLTRSDATQIAWRVRDMVIPFLHRRGLHRGEALALSSHRWAHRFLRACGATRMEPRPELGRRREDFTAHVWLRSELYPDDDATPTQPTGE